MKPGSSDWSREAQNGALSLRFKPGCSERALGTQIEAWGLRFKPGGSDSSLMVIFNMRPGEGLPLRVKGIVNLEKIDDIGAPRIELPRSDGALKSNGQQAHIQSSP